MGRGSRRGPALLGVPRAGTVRARSVPWRRAAPPASGADVGSATRRSCSPSSPIDCEELPAPGAPPALLAHQQLAHRHALDLPRAREHHLGGVDAPGRNLSLQRRPGEPNPVRPLEREHVLRARRYGSVHLHLPGVRQRRQGSVSGVRPALPAYRRIGPIADAVVRPQTPVSGRSSPVGFGRRRRVMGYRVPVGWKRSRCRAAVNKCVTGAVARSGLFLAGFLVQFWTNSRPTKWLERRFSESGPRRRQAVTEDGVKRILTSRVTAVAAIASGLSACA